MDEICIILLFTIVIMIIVIIYLNSQLNKKNNENEILMSNIKNIKKQKEDSEREQRRLEWTLEIKRRTQKEKKKEQYIPSRPLKIIIGDYNKTTVTNTNLVFESLGIETDIVESGYDILERIKNGEKYDAIITNKIYKDGLDGTNLIYRLREIKNFDIPIIILTVDQDKRDYFMREYGFDDYMSKPLTIEKAQVTLKNVFPKINFKKIK